MQMLRSRFGQYKTITDNFVPFTCDELTLLTFGKLIEDSGLLKEESAGHNPDRIGKLTFRELRQAFAGSQGEGSDDVDGHMLRMDFQEFIEALVRITVLRFEQGQLPLIEKLRFTLDAVSTAVPAPTASSRPGSRELASLAHSLFS